MRSTSSSSTAAITYSTSDSVDAQEIPVREATNYTIDGKYEFVYTRASRRTRNTSCLDLKNLATGKVTTYAYNHKLGEGDFATVRSMKDEEGREKTACKKPHQNRIFFPSKESSDAAKETIIVELNFLYQCYPQDFPYAWIAWESKFTDVNGDTAYSLDWRLITPEVNAVSFKHFVSNKHDMQELALAILNTAIEIQRVHDLGISHGDISPRNILIKSDLSVRLIDFYYAYYLDKPPTIFQQSDRSKTYIAPERIYINEPGEAVSVAHPSQDIYSFAKCIKTMFNKKYSTEQKIDFYESFPLIEEFMSDGLSEDPKKRPSLPEFIKNMQKCLTMPNMRNAVISFSGANLTSYLSQKIDNCTYYEINTLIMSLCKDDERINKAQELLNYLVSNVKTYNNNSLVKLFNIIISLKNQFDNMHNSATLFAQTRKNIILKLKTAMQLADSIISYDIAKAEKLHEAVQSFPDLYAIYRDCNSIKDEFSAFLGSTLNKCQ